MNKFIALLLLIFITLKLYAQDIEGPSSAVPNTQSTYTLTATGQYLMPDWILDGGGTIDSESYNSSNYKNTIVITWQTEGVHNLKFKNGSNLIDTKNITVTSPPSTPSTPTISSYNCGSTVVSRGTPPSGTTWFWQTSASGQSTSNSNQTYTITSAGTVYLRAYNGTWSSTSSLSVSVNQSPQRPSSISVSSNSCGDKTLTRANPPGGVTWYWQGTNSNGYSTSNSSASYVATSSGIYYLRARNNSSGCWSYQRAVDVTVNELPQIPNEPIITNQCGSTSVDKSDLLLEPIGESGVNYFWQSTPTGTSTSTMNSTHEIFMSQDTTLYLRGQSDATSCWGPAFTVNVDVDEKPDKPTIDDIQNNCGSTTITRNTPPSGITWFWQGTDQYGELTNNSGANYNVTQAGTYYLRGRNNTSLCWGTSKAITVNIDQPTTYYLDSDGDGFGDPNTSISVCTVPTNYVLDNTDCDDTNPEINPNTIWYTDADGDGFGDQNSDILISNECIWLGGNAAPNNIDCDDSNASIHPNTTWYLDSDDDGYGDDSATSQSCTPPSSDYVLLGGDCNDSNITVYVVSTWYYDGDGDGFGDVNTTLSSCDQPTNYVSNSDDCDDTDNTILDPISWYIDMDGDGYGDHYSSPIISCNPVADYVANSLDHDDSDSLYYELVIWYVDGDKDGFGQLVSFGELLMESTVKEVYGRTVPIEYESAAPPEYYGTGFFSDWKIEYVLVSNDCSDSDAQVGPHLTYYYDGDNDGYGIATDTIVGCYNPTGYVLKNGDTNDSDSLINPATKWYLDEDGDGFGNAVKTYIGSTPPSGNYVLNGDDFCPGTYGLQNGCDDFGFELSYDKNFVLSQGLRVAKNESEVAAVNPLEATYQITYYDDLGRKEQENAFRQSPTYKDLIIHHEYDLFGRELKKYLPYMKTIDGAFDISAASNQADFYENDVTQATLVPFAETRVLHAPGGRVLEQGAPGEGWQLGQNTVKFAYDLADSAEVIYWRADSMLVDSKMVYDAGQLYKNTTTDEDGNETIEYSNKQGQTILKKSQVDGSSWAETYYIYDVYGQLSVVLPPEATARLDAEFFGQSQQARKDFLNTWAFLYDYDARNRMIAKKVPGADSVFMVYDRWDRLVLTQDGVQRPTSSWLFTKYDQLNRPIATGLATITGGIATVRSAVAAATQRHEFFYASGTNQYTNLTYPASNEVDEYLTVTYYDDYAFDDHASWTTLGLGFSDPEGQLMQNTAVKGQVTGTMTKAGDGSWIRSVSYYDDKYRMIQTRSTNHLGGSDAVTNYYDFIGQVNRSISTHNDGSTTTTVGRSFIYDHAGRLLETWHRINSEDSVLIAENNYNELGELVEKNLHNISPSGGGQGEDFHQSLDYTYNIRGWLTSMNSDLIGMDLHYNTNPLDGSNVRYNGNISAMEWTDWDASGQGISDRGYNFGYDKLNRLTAASHFEDQVSTNHFGVQGLDYDLNGNIESLVRKGATGADKDDLSYTYTGNQLQKVADAASDTTGFYDGYTGNIDYTYDANGNMTSDANKGITEIEYNHLNLPIKVTFDAQNYIEYLYDAAGIKLNQVVYKEGDTLKVTDYVGEFIYETDTSGVRKLQLIQHEEGRLTPLLGGAGGGFDYQYHLKDHLGNVRVTFSTTPENYTMVENFETGQENGWEDLHRATNSNANTTPGGDEVELLQSGQTGAMIFLSVNKGDTLDLSVNANYESAPSNNNFLGTAYSTLFTSFDNVYGSGAEGGVSSSSTVFDDAINGTDMGGKDDASSAPRAFLNYIFFNKEMGYVSSGFVQISTSALGVGVHELITLNDRIAETDGYILAYLSNENQEAVNVHFDDFTIYHGKTNVVSTQDYYPFGLTFNESQRVASKKNFMNTFQDQEYEEETGWVKFKWRNHDPAIGRFFNVDPLAESYVHNSPYAFSENKVINHIELEGLEGLHYMEKLNNGGQRHVIEKNVVVLVQAPQAIPEGASENKAARITKRNERTAVANQAKVDAVSSELNSYFNGSDGQATNSAGEPVRFQFNVSGMEVENTNGDNAARTAYQNGQESSEELGGKNLVVPAAILTTKNPSGHGKADGNVVYGTGANAPSGTLAHEVGHTLALPDNYGGTGVMANPPNSVNNKEVDKIIENSLERDKKK